MRQKSHTMTAIKPKMVFEVSDMAIWKLKGCPRCGGDLFLDKDFDSWDEQCLQCAYRRELTKVSRFSEQPMEAEKEPVPVSVGRGRASRRS
ncbi:MAG: hypothetical protein V1767_06475 [Chloroflexota bacterium]